MGSPSIRMIFAATIAAVLFPFSSLLTAQTFKFNQKPFEWSLIKGAARDVGISPAGVTYVASSTGRVWRWGSVLGDEWSALPGTDFVRIDVDASNKPWGVKENGQLVFFNGLYWEKRGEGIVDVGAGRGGFMFAVTNSGTIVSWDRSKRELNEFAKRIATRIDVDKKGLPWIVNETGEIFHYENDDWKLYPGKARDISVGPKGNIFITQEDGSLGRWDNNTRQWQVVAGIKDADSLSVGPNGKPWAVTVKGRIYASALFELEKELKKAQKKAGVGFSKREKPEKKF